MTISSPEPFTLAAALANLADEKKGSDITVLDTQDITSISDYFVIVTAESRTQLQAIAGGMQEVMKKTYGLEAKGVETDLPQHWILLDYGDIVVHLFNPESRQYYQLDNFWRHATVVEESQWRAELKMAG